MVGTVGCTSKTGVDLKSVKEGFTGRGGWGEKKRKKGRGGRGKERGRGRVGVVAHLWFGSKGPNEACRDGVGVVGRTGGRVAVAIEEYKARHE